MRKLGIALIVIIALIIVAIVVIPLVVDVNRYHGLVQSQLEKALGRPVSFGAMHLSMTPPSVRLDNVVIAEDPQFGGGTFAQAHYIDASVKLMPLIRGNVDIRSLTLDQPQVQLIHNAKSVWNFSTLGKKPEAQPQAPKQKSSEGELVLAKLAINNGQVTMIDQAKNSRAVYNNIDVALSDFAPRKPFSLDAALHLTGAGKQTLQLKGTAGPVADNMLATPFDGKLEFNQVSVAGLQKLASIAALEGMDGILTGTLNAKNDKGVLSSEGSLKLTDALIKRARVDYPITLDYKATDDLNKDQIHIDSAKLHLGQTPIVIDGDINAGPTPAQLNMHVSLKETSIEEAARLASAFGVAFNPSMKVSGNVTADIRATGAANAPAMNGSIVGKNVRISGGELKEPVDVGAMSLDLTPQQIRSAPFTATSGGTKVAVQFALADYSGPSPAIDASVKTANAKVHELLSIARAYGVDAVKDVDGTGDINLDLHAAGPLKNASALNFSGSGKIANSTIKTPDLTQPLNVKNADLRFTSNSMTMQNLAASIGHTNAGGNVTLQNFSAPQVQFTLTADKVNVAELQQLTATPPAKRAAKDSSGWPTLDGFARVGLIPSAYAQAVAPPSLIEKMTGGGAITVGTVEYDQLILQNLKATVAIDHGVIRMSPVTAAVYNGQETGSITIDLRQKPMAVSINSKLDQVDANKLLSSVSSVKETLYGLLAANANTSFRAASSQEIARTLNGNLNIDLTKGRLAHVDVLNQLSQIARFTGGTQQAAAQPFTDIARLTGSFNVVNGLAQTSNLKALIPGGSLAAEGAVNLADQGLNMHVTAILEKALSQQVGGTQVGGFMNTALANAQGELVIPVLVTGTLNSPHFAPDLQKIAQMKLQNLLPTAANPGGAVSGILGAVLGGKNPQGQQQQQGGLGGILGALGGQQKQQQQNNQNQPVANPQQPPNQAQPQQQNPLGDIFNQVLQNTQKKKQQPQQQPPPAPPK
jgi:uncharacterized protein involved in outer membrane biogenesis